MPQPRRRLPQTPRDSLDLFTNRLDERAEFAQLIDPTTPRRPVLHFYGVGGTGKTRLIDRLCEDARLADLPAARLDFDTRPGANPLHGNEPRALGEIRQQLGVECPRFDLAIAWLQYRESAGSAEPLALDNWAKTAGGLIGELASAAAPDVPGANVALWILKKASKPVAERLQNSALLERVNNDGLKDFFRLKQMTKEDICLELTTRLCDDLRERLPERGSGCRGVLFIDTFEALRGGLDRSSRENLENWVHDLAVINGQDGPLLIVIAGRDRSRWADRDSDWSDPAWLMQHCLGGLSETDARDLLARMGLGKGELQDAILRASRDAPEAEQGETGFHAFSLATCGNAALNEVKRGVEPSPSSFELPPNNWRAISRRFLQSLSTDADREWLRALALTPRFDRTAAVSARSPVVEAAWDGLLDFSFVQPIEGKSGWWRLHVQMTDALREVLAEDESSWRDHHKRWQARWSARHQTETDVFAGLAWYHEYALEGSEAGDRWKGLAESARRDLRMEEHHALLAWWHAVALWENPQSPEAASSLFALGNELREGTLGNIADNLWQAITFYEAALRVYTKEASPENWAAQHNGLGTAWLNLPTGDRSENLQRAISCYEAALSVSTEEASPESWARAQNNLGTALFSLPTDDRAENVKKALACYQAALHVCSEQAFPELWSAIQNNLGLAWPALPTGDRSENREHAIACFEAALCVRTEENFPQDWASTQNNLGSAWANLLTGDPNRNQENAITCYEAALRVYTEENFPQSWAGIQHNLGMAWWNIVPQGDRTHYLQRSIACYEAALRVYTTETFPQLWSRTQNNLGLAWANLPTGDRSKNLKQAIACYEAALSVDPKETSPEFRAVTQNNLGSAWEKLPTGDLGENLKQAFACYEAALGVFTEGAFRENWAAVQNNLGNAFSRLPTGDRTQHRQRAIACYKAALRVYSEEVFPRDWARTQHNLGLAWADLSTGDQGENLRRAIGFFEAASRVCTKEDFPQGWAEEQINLGSAWANLPTGDRNENLRRAISYYEAALNVMTEENSRVNWAATQNNLGSVFWNLATGDRAQNLQRAIACYEAALRVYTEEGFPLEWASTNYNLGPAWLRLPTGGQRRNLRRAIACYEAALRVYTEEGFPEQYAVARNHLKLAIEALQAGPEDEVDSPE